MTEDNLPTIINQNAHLTPIYTAAKVESQYIRSPSGAIKRTYFNLLLTLRHHPDYAHQFRYSKQRQANMLYAPPVWAEASFRPREITKRDLTYLKSDLEKHGLHNGKAAIIDCLNAVCAENYLNDLLPPDVNPLLDSIRDIIERDPLTNTKLIARELNMDSRRAYKIGETLRELGYERIGKRVNGKPRSVWIRPDQIIDATFTESET